MEHIEDTVPPAILVLSQSAFITAKKIRDYLPHSVIYSHAGCVPENNNEYCAFPEFIQQQYKAGRPVIALCATGIVIRSLAPLLNNKLVEPPVIVVAKDGSCVIPLLGAARGANRLAEKLARALGCQAAVTTSGELRFGINLLCPPDGLELSNRHDGKTFVAALLNGATVRIEGEHPWLANARLPLSDTAAHVIRILPGGEAPSAKANELIYRQLFPIRKGRVSIIGLGPGPKQFRTVSAERVLKDADDILGYDFYINLAGPFARNQTIHKSSNREELARAHHALALAAQGRHAALVSSGDPGIYAMAAAVFEAWEHTDEAWADNIDMVIEPGVSAAFAAAARFGAPLGHDFTVISLSDNLKSWEIIEKRLRLASKADMVLALYNPVSKTRTEQIDKVVGILRQERLPNAIIALAHDIARQDEMLKITTLEQLQIQDITSRTVLLVGSSKTRIFRKNGRNWIYTPRSYRES